MSRRMNARWGAFCALSATGLMLAGCGGGGGSSSPTSPTPSASTGVTESFSSIQSQVFNTRCISCHGSVRLEQGLNLQTNAYNNLVNRRSTQSTGLFLVSPGNPEQSYLIHKLDGRSGIQGTQMPQGASPLSATDIDVIKRWIQNGAANN